MRNHNQVVLDYISNTCYNNYLEVKMLLQNNYKIIADYRTTVLQLIENCKSEPNMDKKIQLLYDINSILLKSDQLQILSVASLHTNYYINTVLHKIEAAMLSVN
jgi:hypothetical protein